MSPEFEEWHMRMAGMSTAELRHEAANYRHLYEGMRRRPNTSVSVSQKWLVGILTTIVLAGGAGWMTSIASEQKKQGDEATERKRDTAVIKEKVERLERDVKEIKEDSKEQSRKLDELLRRVR